MESELKPCPWCGAAPLMMQQYLGRYACCSTACDDSELCSTAYHHEDDWNHRPVEDALRARAEAAEQRAEAAEVALAQAHADRTLLIGLWLATVPPGVLPALLPADLGDLDRLAAALEAVDLQSGTESHTAAVRAVIGRIVRVVAEMAGGAR